MKRLLCFATAFCLVLPSLALGAPSSDRKRPPHRDEMTIQPVKPGKPHRPPHHRPPSHRPPSYRPPTHRPPSHRPPHHRPPHHRPPTYRPPHHRPPVWHRPTRDRWYWRGHWINRIRGSMFIYPHGYGYRHWVVGDRMPALFLATRYFYDNVAPLGLQPPPPGYRWVRYGPDLLLVNLRTGIVEDVAYGVFY